jgi:hypothetical protein
MTPLRWITSAAGTETLAPDRDADAEAGEGRAVIDEALRPERGDEATG